MISSKNKNMLKHNESLADHMDIVENGENNYNKRSKEKNEMINVDHLAKEFEKLHDEFPKLLVHVALLEEWQRIHPDTHRLEGVALSIIKNATDLRLESMNELRKQIETERGSFVARELYDREHSHRSEER